MSDNLSNVTLDKYLSELEERSVPNSNDRRHGEYVKYTNAFLSCFGKEFAFLSGSTGENLKLRWSKDGGDADFILCSGKLILSVDELEFNRDFPCYLWVKPKKSSTNLGIDLLDTEYLPGDVLRRVDPELFTILRAIYLMVTSTTHYVPGRETEITTTGIESKVGLARVEYQGLQVDGNALKKRSKYYKNVVVKRDADFKKYLDKRKQGLKNYPKDIEGIEKILKFVSNTKFQGGTGDHSGQWQHFAHVVDLVIRRRRDDVAREEADQAETSKEISKPLQEQYDETQTYENDLDASGRKLRATYTEKTSKDFVPALLIVGKLPCMEEWRKQEHRWLTSDVVQEIYDMDVFVVARYAPINPSSKDFCLSFSKAERKLAECLTPAQRKIILIMKAYIKGFLKKRHDACSRDLRLTSFHIKTMMYQVSDITDPAVWQSGNILEGLIKVLEYMRHALTNKELLHYFVPSNLFAGFEDDDFKLLLKCTDELLTDPVGCITPFFDLDDGCSGEVWLSEEEVMCLQNLSDDGGVKREMDRLEEAIIEIQRGFNDGPRDEYGNAPIAEAISRMGQAFMQDEGLRILKEKEKKQDLPQGLSQLLGPMLPGIANMIGNAVVNPEGDALMGILGQFMGNTSSRNREENRRIEEELKYKGNAYFLGKPL